MELAYSLFFWSSICLLVVLLLQSLWGKARNSCRQLPPGPRGWPLVGNLFDLGEFPHLTLFKLENIYGPVVWLRFGVMNTVVIQSTKAAKEMFKNHDLTYSGRTIIEAMKPHNYHERSMGLAQYGPYWRVIKRLFITEMAANQRLNETATIRRKGIDKMIQWIEEEANNQGAVHVAHFVFIMTFNMFGNIMLSRDLIDPQSDEGSEFFNAMDTWLQVVAQPNLADFFPTLRWLDPQGIRKKIEQNMGHAMDIVSGFLKERIEDQASGEQKKKRDFLDILLKYEGEGDEEPVKISDKGIVTLVLEFFIGGTETTSSTIEWAMTELLRSNETMSKARKELADVVGCNRKIEESDIEELPYLQAVVKETLRLHPPLPFLVSRKVVKDNNFLGYDIPKDTQVFVNAWAIGRDPDSWVDPLSFMPERFLDSDVNYRGQHFEFIPFGAGRRMCPGIPIAHQVLHLALGSLLHCFDWELDQPVNQQKIDMNERMGITLRKEVPLKAVAKKRNVYYNL